MKKVLVISYYWPPSGGAGVQRWLKFTKYLPEFDWVPVVYTPENPEAPVDDPSLLNDVHPEAEVVKRTIWEPYAYYKRFVGMRKGERVNAGFLSEGEKPPRKEGLSVWIRGNLFVPDARRFWIRPSIRYLKTYLKKHPVDAIVSTGPPHSMHLIALGLHRELGIPWIADFRDPWTEIDFYDQLRLTGWADRKHRRLEQEVLRGADRVVVVGKTMAERFRLKAPVEPVVIPNGFDKADFAKKETPETISFSIVHVGAMNRDRNHTAFWKAVSDLKRETEAFGKHLKIRLVGKLDHSVLRSIDEFHLGESVEITPSLPHDQVIPLLQSASVLYLPINNTPNARSIATGKLFEYLSARRPILGIGPTEGDAAAILKECNAGEMIDFEDVEGVKRLLGQWEQQHRKGTLTTSEENIDQYSRRHLSEQYAGLLNEIVPAP
ncbi:MAG: glycosyltransferase [Bacteroidales bacterium]